MRWYITHVRCFGPNRFEYWVVTQTGPSYRVHQDGEHACVISVCPF